MHNNVMPRLIGKIAEIEARWDEEARDCEEILERRDEDDWTSKDEENYQDLREAIGEQDGGDLRAMIDLAKELIASQKDRNQ